MSRNTRRRRLALATGAALSGVLFLSACSTDTNDTDNDSGSSDSGQANAASSNDDPGKKVVIGFSGPAADHGWLAAINSSAIAEAKKYSDVELKTAEGTNDANQQISQVETFINDKVDAIVLLPTDGAALTDVATKAMEAGIPVVNVDREFSTPFAARTTVLGDNYGMGVSAGTYACDVIEKKGLDDAVVAEIAGIDALPLTQDRSKGFARGPCAGVLAEALRAVLGQGQRVDAGDLGDDGVLDALVLDHLAGVGAGRDAHAVVVAEDRGPSGERGGELTVDVDHRDAGLHRLGGDVGQRRAVGRQQHDRVDLVVDEGLDLADLLVGVVGALGGLELHVGVLLGLRDRRAVDGREPAVVGGRTGEPDHDLLARVVVGRRGLRLPAVAAPLTLSVSFVSVLQPDRKSTPARAPQWPARPAALCGRDMVCSLWSENLMAAMDGTCE